MGALAHIVTATRLVAAAALLACDPAGAVFWTLYAWCGVGDMIDGPIARATGSAGVAGARLDSLADLVFAAACLVKVVSAVHLDVWLLIWLAAIAVCKIGGYARSCRSHGRIVAPHTLANKATGLVLFATVPVLVATGACAVTVPACVVATYAAVQEAVRPVARGME